MTAHESALVVGTPAPKKKRRPLWRRFRALRHVRDLGRVTALLWPYARPYRRMLLLAGLATVLLIAFQLAQPWPLKWLIDAFFGKHKHRLHLLPKDFPLAGYAALFLILTLGVASLTFVQRLLYAGIGNRMLFAFRTELFHRVLEQPVAFHEARSVGELLTRVVYDTQRLRRAVNAILVRSVQTVLLFGGTIAVLFWIDPGMAAVLGGAGLVCLVAMGGTGRRIFKAARKHRRREGKLASVVEEDLHGIRELHTYRAGQFTDDRFEKRNNKSLKQEQKVRRLAAALQWRVEIILGTGLCLALWMGIERVQSGLTNPGAPGALTPGDLVLFLHYARALRRPLRRFARQTAQTGRALAAAERLRKIMRREPGITDSPEAVAAPTLAGAVTFGEVSLKSPKGRRGSRKRVLKQVTLEIASGTRVAIIGPNGAGKSSLLKLLLRLEDPTAGSIRVDGTDIRAYTLQSYRSQISAVFQQAVFFRRSIEDNVRLGRADATPEDVVEALARAQVTALVDKLPKGLRTPLKRGGELLSGGERQRLSLARALVRNGSIWALDEPTSGLDAEVADRLTRLLFEVTEGRTTLWVTHDMTLVPHMDQVLFMRNGRVRFFGSPAAWGQWIAKPQALATPPGERGALPPFDLS